MVYLFLLPFTLVLIRIIYLLFKDGIIKESYSMTPDEVSAIEPLDDPSKERGVYFTNDQYIRKLGHWDCH
jgi:hypothetical protein